ncbi:hypothetical protein RB195_011792 [Necator americanus]|uniref:Reverse transcriptase domain-containing protein n=1 Tax=Necator americanus TaxID=51031 RepID=A0ABR1D419_NECAM
MPRFIESRTWRLLRNVPARYHRLVREALSLRQKITVSRQSIHFLHRCLTHRVVPRFIDQKQLHVLCGVPKNNRQLVDIQTRLLRTCLRAKQDELHANIKKCLSKELSCSLFLDERFWRRTVGGSISICDSIRSKTKSALRKKFDSLLSRSRSDSAQKYQKTFRSDLSHRETTANEQSLSATSRVTVLGGISISKKIQSALELGPSFSPSQPISTAVLRKIACNLQELQDRLRQKAKSKTTETAQQQSKALPPILFPRTFFRQQEPNAVVDISIRLFADELFNVLDRYRRRKCHPNITHEQRLGIREVRELVKSKTIRLSTSDKGGEFVVIPRHLDESLTLCHLQDSSLYSSSTVEEFLAQHRRLNRVWMSTSKSTQLPQLKTELPVCPVLYLLIKTHKLNSDSELASEDPSTFKMVGQLFCANQGGQRLAWDLAMGQRLAPTLAIAFMAKIEAPIWETRFLLYCRYIDDCFLVCSSQAEMDNCFKILNEQSEYITFTRDKPKGEWLPFLNVQVHISNRTHRTKWYRKPSNKNILVHFLSAHPTQVQRSVVRNMFRTATSVCTGREERRESIELARKIAVTNGYTPMRSITKRAQTRNKSGMEKVPFCVLFISDEVSAAIRRFLRKAKLEESVAIVELPSSCLKQILIRNRLYDRICTTPECKICPDNNEGDCMSSCVVYMICCVQCGDEYIGETARPLCIRIKEHLDGKRKSCDSTALGGHRVRRHNGEDFVVKITILAREPSIAARKALEAFWIHSKSPKMNRKEECLSITRELAPYLRLIFGSEEGDIAETLATNKGL